MPGGFDFRIFDDLPSLLIYVLVMIALVTIGVGLAVWALGLIA